MDKKGILQALITHYTGGNKSQFAKLLGVKPQTINTWDTRGTFDLELIYSKCEYISGDWLLTGEGPMLKSGTPSPSEPTPKPKKSEKTSNAEDATSFLSYIREQATAHAQLIKEKDAVIEQKNQEIMQLRCDGARLEAENRYLTNENQALHQQLGRLEGDLQQYRLASAPASPSTIPAPPSAVPTPPSAVSSSPSSPIGTRSND